MRFIGLLFVISTLVHASPTTEGQYRKAVKAFTDDAKPIAVLDAKGYDVNKGTCLIGDYFYAPARYEIRGSSANVKVVLDPVLGDHTIAAVNLEGGLYGTTKYHDSGPMTVAPNGELQSVISYGTALSGGNVYCTFRKIDSATRPVWMIRVQTVPNASAVTRRDVVCYYWKE